MSMIKYFMPSISDRGWLALVAILLLGGAAQAQPKPLVVATASIFADMAQNIAGDELEIRSIVPIGGDPHIYEPTPGDARLVAGADLILRNGLTFEGWINKLIANSGTKARTVTITEGIAPIQSTQYKNATDPHAWMDASLGLRYLENIKNALVDLYPDGAPVFEFNYEVYRQQLADMDRYIQEQILSIPEQQRILITSHDAFRYYGQRYGIRVEAVLGTSTDAEAQTSDIIRLSRIIQESGVPAIFVETTVNPRLIQQLARDNKIRIGGNLYADSIGDAQSPAPSYLDMLQYNTDAIVAALTLSDNTEPQKPADSPGTTLIFGIISGVLLLGGFYLVFKKLNG
ncbi:MAG TPA: zinc ABC transporter substrate-binding protein [Saprospiraceae bacterium]|mgnify:CR=1 FL=1|nr:zinc ABC transporter substrate-binding protein [Saprospiraceae bacterium]HMP24276.1 zinc ABC transporter substrate-binding protein [Saprospiraceae bacterium]